MLRLREEEGVLRDAEHLADFDAAPTPRRTLASAVVPFLPRTQRGRIRPVIRAPVDCLELPPHMDCEALIALLREGSTHENPLVVAARVSAVTLHILDNVSSNDAEIRRSCAGSPSPLGGAAAAVGDGNNAPILAYHFFWRRFQWRDCDR